MKPRYRGDGMLLAKMLYDTWLSLHFCVACCHCHLYFDLLFFRFTIATESSGGRTARKFTILESSITPLSMVSRSRCRTAGFPLDQTQLPFGIIWISEAEHKIFAFANF